MPKCIWYVAIFREIKTSIMSVVVAFYLCIYVHMLPQDFHSQVRESIFVER
jgi:hypothetical protein